MRHLPFQPALEGLRGLAVLAVLLFHAGVPGAGGGFLGVSTFFTLSGFLITGLLVAEREREGAIRLRAFWGRRLRRLMPAALLGLAAIALLGWLFGDYSQRDRLQMDGFSALFYVANWWLIASGAAYADLMGSPSFTQHFWSLAIEEQYYAVFPLVAAVLLSRGRRPLAAALAVGTLLSWGWTVSLELSTAPTARIYYGTDSRAGELLVGGLLALLLAGRPVSGRSGRTLAVLGGVGLAVTAVFWGVADFESIWLYRGGLAVYAIASTAVVAGCVAPGGPVRRLLSQPPLRWLGRVSYGAYVYHWPIFLVVDARTGLDPWTLFATRVALTFGAAWASRRWLEDPILNGRALSGWRSGVAAAAAFLAIGFSLSQTRPRADLPEIPAEPAPLVAGAPRVAVLGDSVADDVAAGLEAWAHRTGEAQILNLAIRGCGLATGAWPDDIGRRPRVCDRWRDRARRWLTRFRPDVIVAVTAVWEVRGVGKAEWGGPRALGDVVFDAWLVDELVRTTEFLQQFGSPVVWLTAPCIRRVAGGQQGAFDPARVAHLNADILPSVRAASTGATRIVDLYGAVCPGGRFMTGLYGIQPFRRDGVHFTEGGQRWVGEWLGPQLVAATKRPAD